MGDIIMCEIIKLKNSKIMWLCFVGALAVPVMMIIEAIQIHYEHPEQQITLAKIYDNSLLYAMLLMNMMICVAVISYIFSREYADGTLKTILTVPVSRVKLVMGKLIVTAMITTLINLITWAGLLVFSTVFYMILGMQEFLISSALRYLFIYIAAALLMFLASIPYAYIAIKTKGYIAPMVTSAAMVMGSAALCNQKIGALYPWTIIFFIMKNGLADSKYPIWISIVIVICVIVGGVMTLIRYFVKEDL